MSDERLIRLPEVVRLTGLSKSELYRRAAAGTFPAPRRISYKVSVWAWSEVKAWIERMISIEELIG